MVRFFLMGAFVVLVFFPIYFICCPYYNCENPADEDYYNYLAGFDQFL